MTSPRVAYVLETYPRETFVLNELVELERQGVQLSVFSLERPTDRLAHAEVEGLRAGVTYLPESLPALLLAQRHLLRGRPLRLLTLLVRAARQRRIALVKHVLQAGAVAAGRRVAPFDHLHAQSAAGATSVALHASALTGIPYSLTVDATDIFRESAPLSDLSHKLERAQFAVTVSDFSAERLRLVARGTTIVRIYNGIDVDRFHSTQTRADQPPLVLGAGPLVEQKGFSALVRACAILYARGIDFSCTIVGEGPLKHDLHALVERLRVGDRVSLAGPLRREQLLDLYRRAAVFAAPGVVASDGEDLPTVLVEAMAAGVPVVTTPVMGIPELVEDGVTGLLVPERDPAALADAVARLVADEELSNQLAVAARERIEERFELRRNVRQLRRLFEEAVAE